MPVPHWPQLPELERPEPVWYVPVPHRLQPAKLEKPVPVWYVPAPHRLQLEDPEPVPYMPGPHRLQALLELAEEYAPTGQIMGITEVVMLPL